MIKHCTSVPLLFFAAICIHLSNEQSHSALANNPFFGRRHELSRSSLSETDDVMYAISNFFKHPLSDLEKSTRIGRKLLRHRKSVRGAQEQISARKHISARGHIRSRKQAEEDEKRHIVLCQIINDLGKEDYAQLSLEMPDVKNCAENTTVATAARRHYNQKTRRFRGGKFSPLREPPLRRDWGLHKGKHPRHN